MGVHQTIKVGLSEINCTSHNGVSGSSSIKQMWKSIKTKTENAVVQRHESRYAGGQFGSEEFPFLLKIHPSPTSQESGGFHHSPVCLLSPLVPFNAMWKIKLVLIGRAADPTVRHSILTLLSVFNTHCTLKDFYEVRSKTLSSCFPVIYRVNGHDHLLQFAVLM